jgi:hypothetical protein
VKSEKDHKPGYYLLPADATISHASVMTNIFVEALRSNEEEIVIDASKIYWISPFTACWFAALKDNFEALNKSYFVDPPKRENAWHQFDGLGIAKYILPDWEAEPPKWFSTFPVTKLTEPSYPLAGQVVKILTEKLRGVENFHKALHFAVREIIENAFEHGKTDHCYMCAYSVPSKRLVRLCILDTGIGIPNSIRSSKKYNNLKDDIQAVEKASEYGVSSKSEERGIGLYLLRDVAEKNEAVLSILSGKAKVDISNTIEKTPLDIGFPGTVVKLMLRTRKDFYYTDVTGWDAL